MRIDLDLIQIGLIIEVALHEAEEWRTVAPDHERAYEYEHIAALLGAYQGGHINEGIAKFAQ